MAIPATSTLGQQLTGARCVFEINGKVFAWGAGISWSHNYQYEEYITLNAFETLEHVPTRYTATFSCQAFQLINQNLTTFGLQPQMGNDGQEHLANVAALGDVTSIVTDSLTNKLLATAYGIRFQANSIDVNPNTLSMGNISLSCLRVVEYGN